MKKLSLKWLFNITVLALSFGILFYFAFSEDGLLDLVKNVKGVSPGWLAAAGLCVVVDLSMDCQSLYLCTRNLHPEYRYRDAFRASMTGEFFSAVTPFASGGQPMQIYLMSQQGVPASASLSALIQKFLVYQGGMTGYALALLLLSGEFFSEKLSAYMIVAVLAFLVNLLIIVFILLFSFNRRLTDSILRGLLFLLGKLKIMKKPEEKLQKIQAQLTVFHDNNVRLHQNGKLFFKILGCTLVQLTAIFLIPFCIYQSFGYPDFPLVEMLTANSFVNMIAAFIPLPGGSGGAEGSFLIYFSLFFTPGTLKPAIFIWRFLSYYAQIFLSAPFALAGKKRAKAKAPQMAA